MMEQWAFLAGLSFGFILATAIAIFVVARLYRAFVEEQMGADS